MTACDNVRAARWRRRAAGSTSCDGRACHGPHRVRPLPSRRWRSATSPCMLVVEHGGDAAGVFGYLVLGGAGVLRFAARRARHAAGRCAVAVAAGGGDRAGEPAFLGVGFHRALPPRRARVLPGEPRVRRVHGPHAGIRAAAALESASRVLTSDRVMALFGNAAPTVGLMLSMAARLVPQFVRRGADDRRRATRVHARPGQPSAKARRRRSRARRGAALRDSLRLSSVLMGWSMEDSLETAERHDARAAGERPRGARRTRAHRFRRPTPQRSRWAARLRCWPPSPPGRRVGSSGSTRSSMALHRGGTTCPMRCTRFCRCRWRQGSACGGGHEGGRSNDGTGARKREGQRGRGRAAEARRSARRAARRQMWRRPRPQRRRRPRACPPWRRAASRSLTRGRLRASGRSTGALRRARSS